jgi:transcriptional regulator with XRE-family HTH domain
MAAEAPSLGTRIKRARERLRLTQEELGKRVGKSVRTVNDWENDRTYPKNSMGALEELFGHSLEGPEELPPLVARHTDDPRIMAIWNIKIIPPRSREGMIAYLLERDGPRPANGASRSHASS